MEFRNQLRHVDGIDMCSGRIDNCSNNPHVGYGRCGYLRKNGTCASNFARDEHRWNLVKTADVIVSIVETSTSGEDSHDGE